MAEYILRTNSLTKKYKNDFALKDVNVTIRRGEIYGLIGQNGAGKTTMLRLIWTSVSYEWINRVI